MNNRQAFSALQRPLLYHCALPEMYPGWPVALELCDADVLNGFFLYSILLDRAERNVSLVLQHGTTHRDRLADVLHDCNCQTEGIGQEQYFHACDECFQVFEQDGQLCMCMSVSSMPFPHKLC